MSLVRMTWDGKPLYVSNEAIESIRPRGGETADCYVQYLEGRERVVDGTPDEVFKALYASSVSARDMEIRENISTILSQLRGNIDNGSLFRVREAFEVLCRRLEIAVPW